MIGAALGALLAVLAHFSQNEIWHLNDDFVGGNGSQLFCARFSLTEHVNIRSVSNIERLGFDISNANDDVHPVKFMGPIYVLDPKELLP